MIIINFIIILLSIIAPGIVSCDVSKTIFIIISFISIILFLLSICCMYMEIIKLGKYSNTINVINRKLLTNNSIEKYTEYKQRIIKRCHVCKKITCLCGILIIKLLKWLIGLNLKVLKFLLRTNKYIKRTISKIYECIKRKINRF